MKTAILSLLLPFLAVHSANAQSKSSDSSIIGVWKGSSVCQVKNSPCHDEVVVYYISQARGADTFNIAANKIVNGKEEEMGTIAFRFDRKTNQLISTSNNGVWTFLIKENKLEGTLVYRESLYRIIKLSKQR